MSLHLPDLPYEIVVEILLCAAYQSPKFARSLAVVSSWTNKLAQQALFSTISVVRVGELKRLFNFLDLVKGPFPKGTAVVDLFRLSFKDILQLNPSQAARERARLIHNLWLIPLEGHDRIAKLEDHIYTRLTLQLCSNIKSLALTGTAFSHFLINKAEHFSDARGTDADEVAAVGWSPYPHLTHLTLLDSTPALIMEQQYTRSQECVKIFKQITHFTTYGFFHINGLPVPVDNFASLTHVALPFVLSNILMQENHEPTASEAFLYTGGWKLLQSSPQIQMVVFMFPSDGRLYIGSHLSNLYISHSPTSLILAANQLHNKAYALPVDGLNGLQTLWHSTVRGGPSLWDIAEDTLRRHRHDT